MRTGLRQIRRHQRMQRGIASAKAGRLAADVLDSLIAERDEWVESGAAHEYSETCDCEECIEARQERTEAFREYERIAR